jgi:predicted alpha/beta-fold hydrolase
MIRIKFNTILFFLLLPNFLSANDFILPISFGFGADGDCGFIKDSISSKYFFQRKIYIYHSVKGVQKKPAIFLCHALGSKKPSYYEHIMEHCASNGYTVVFVSYRISSFPHQKRTFRKIFNSFEYVVDQFSQYIDTSRIGLVSHSFGGSATPYLTLKMIKEKKWGGNGCFMFIMAPSFFLEISQKELETFPSYVKLLLQVYEEDDCNDHRIARDLFLNINIPNSEKDFMVIMSDSSATYSYKLDADHALPFNSSDPEGEVDGLDYYGIFRYIDALAEYAFTENLQAKKIALGNGNKMQRFMGMWSDNTPVKLCYVSDNPRMFKNINYYHFNWYHPLNFRRKELEKLLKQSIKNPFKANYTDKFDNTQNSVITD